MIGIKDMSMPCNCWNCELTHDNYSGLTICSLTGNLLYPMGSKNERDEDCPLIEIEENEQESSLFGEE